jgi:hypothetical protein
MELSTFEVVLELAHLGAVGIHCLLIDVACLVDLVDDNLGVTVCRMDLPGPTTSLGTRTNYSVGPWDYTTWVTRHLMTWGARTTEEEYSNRKLYMSCTEQRTPGRTRLVLSPQTDL